MAILNCNEICAVLKRVLHHDQGMIALHEPIFAGNEWQYVKKCLDTGWVSSVGGYVDHFEAMLAETAGVSHAVAVVNGTAALHLCLKLAGVETGDEVLVPALTFVATPNAVSYCGAVPHFVDSEITTLGIDPDKLLTYLRNIAILRNDECFNGMTGRRIKALVPVHAFGHPADLDPLAEVCEQFRLVLIEDATESLGSYYKGKHTGQWGKLSALSFNGNKIVTTGGGGAILTNDERIARLAKHLTTTAKVPHRWEFRHDMVGYNYRLPNINAALGCAQMEQLTVFIERKRDLAGRYQQAFANVEGVRFVMEPKHSRSNYWLNALLLDDADQRDALLAATNDAGIMTRPSWKLMHELPMYVGCPRMDLAVAECLEGRLVNIPSSASLGVCHGQA